MARRPAQEPVADAAAISFDRDEIAAALAAVVPIVNTRDTIPILSHVLLRAGGGQLRIVGTNLDMMLQARCEAAGDAETTVNAGTIAAAVGGLRPGRIDMTIDGGKVVLRQGRATRSMPALPVADFPEMPMDDGAVRIELSTAAFARLLDSVAHAQSQNEVQTFLHGVYLHHRDGLLVAAATDKNIIAEASLAGVEGVEKIPGVILSYATVAVLQKLTGKQDGLVALEIAETKISVSFGATGLLAKLVEGTFPQYRQLLTNEQLNRVRVSAGELDRAVAAVSSAIQAEKKQSYRSLQLDVSAEGPLDFTARDMLGNEAIEPLDGSFEGEAQAIGLNSRQAANLARMFDPESELTLALDSPRSPLLVTSDAEPDLICLVSQMRIGGAA